MIQSFFIYKKDCINLINEKKTLLPPAENIGIDRLNANYNFYLSVNNLLREVDEKVFSIFLYQVASQSQRLKLYRALSE